MYIKKILRANSPLPAKETEASGARAVQAQLAPRQQAGAAEAAPTAGGPTAVFPSTTEQTEASYLLYYR